MSNIKNTEKPKPKTGSTALQEQASLAAIYYAYKKGATLNDEKVIKNASKASKRAQLELDIALKEIYPAMKSPKIMIDKIPFHPAKLILSNSNCVSSHLIGLFDNNWSKVFSLNIKLELHSENPCQSFFSIPK